MRNVFVPVSERSSTFLHKHICIIVFVRGDQDCLTSVNISIFPALSGLSVIQFGGDKFCRVVFSFVRNVYLYSI